MELVLTVGDKLRQGVHLRLKVGAVAGLVVLARMDRIISLSAAGGTGCALGLSGPPRCYGHNASSERCKQR